MLAPLHALLARVRGFLRPGTVAADTDAELEALLALAEDDKVRSGRSRGEARRLARLELGGVAQLREATRAARGLPMLDAVWLDLKLSARMLRKSWGLTLVGGLALTTAISIGAGLFNTMHGITGASLPLEDGDAVVALMVSHPRGQGTSGVPLADVQRWQGALRSVQQLGAFRTVRRNFTMQGRPPEVVSVAEVTATGFEVARVQPLLGRAIQPDDVRAGAEPVIVIGHGVWTSSFDADPRAIGRVADIDGVAHTIVGVMPEGFAFPVNHAYWTPLRIAGGANAPRPDTPVIAFGRLAAGVSLEAADRELETVGLQSAGEPDSDDRRPRVLPYVKGLTGTGGAAAAMQRFIFMIAALLLIPPCGNIAILVYARTVNRQREFAARYALGGSRGRIVGQLYLETLLLVAIATAAALVIVSRVGAFMEGLVRLPHGNPFWLDLSTIPIETVVVAAILAAVAAGIVGILPALQAVGRLTSAAAVGGRASLKLGTMWTGLIAAQVALSIAVLPVVGELAWGGVRQSLLGPGFDATQVLTATVTTSRAQDGAATVPDTLSSSARIRSQIAGWLNEFPEVRTVTWSASAPGTEPEYIVDVEPRGQSARVQDMPSISAMGNAVEPGFFAAFGMHLVAGTLFEETTAGAGPLVVNRTLARTLAGEQSPIGWRLRTRRVGGPAVEDGSWQEIVGVVDDLNASSGRKVVYRLLPERHYPLSLSARMTSGAPRVAAALRDRRIGIDRDVQISDIASLADLNQRQTRVGYLTGLMLGSGTLSVLLLTAAGIYALMAFTVARQRREIGIRCALGARPARLLLGVLGRAGRQLALGGAVGVLLAIWLSAYLRVETVGGADAPAMIPAAVLLTTIVGLCAAAGPARRALRLQPTEVLRDE